MNKREIQEKIYSVRVEYDAMKESLNIVKKGGLLRFLVSKEARARCKAQAVTLAESVAGSAKYSSNPLIVSYYDFNADSVITYLKSKD